ncbi:MAG TPA: MASE4 domain-containing protein [Bauldia sp.]|nr:MASE4 domain-containing protein [Bauldia sp.]
MAMRAEAEVLTGINGAAETDTAPAAEFIATATADRSQRRMALGVVAVSVIVFLALIPVAQVKLVQLPAFIPAYEAALIVIDLVTAVLLLGQFMKLRSRAMLVLAAGYLFDALIMIPHALSFPGGFGPAGVIGGGNQTTVWTYALWHATFPLFIIGYAFLKDEPQRLSTEVAQSMAVAAASFIVVVVGAMSIAVTVGHDHLPPLLVNGAYSPTYIFLLSATWGLSIAAVALLWWRGLRSILDIWVAAVMCVWVFDIALSAVFNAARYDLGFYAGRAYGLLAASFVLIVVLLENSGLFSRVAETAEALKGQTAELKGTVKAQAAKQAEIEAQLRQSQKMEAIGNLTGGMAHDFNNLLAVVIGNLDMLVNRRKNDADVQELGNEARDAALQGADLTRRLLAFARRQPLEPRRTNINDLISNHAQLLRRLLGAQIDIRLDLSATIWPAIIDPTQLEAAITNLATNARDAMPQGGSLTIATGNRHLDEDYAATHAEVTPGDYALIEVTDSGSGIPQEVIARIFEPFFTTKEVGKGTGLGLSMIYGFIKQSKGHVSVYSEPGIGTTFRLYLPRVDAGEAAEAVTAAVDTERGNGEMVLAVEDVAALRRVVVRQLTDLGYRVLEAENAADALEVLAKEKVDLLFTDVILAGGQTGFDLARAARARWPNLKVVFTSGFPDNKLGNGSGPAATGKLLGKPYRKEDLAKALRAALAGG